MAKIEGKLVDFSISTVLTEGSEVWKRLICGTDANLDGTAETTSKSTKCGTRKSRGPANWVLSGGFEADSAPTSDQYSADELINLFQDGTPVRWKMEHLTDENIVHRSGLGTFSAYGETYGVDDNMAGTYTVEVDGNITTIVE